MYGHHVHEAVLAAFKAGKIKYSAVTMHFVTEEYDKGPTCMEVRVPVFEADTVETLAKRVNEAEHEWQWHCTDKIINGEIYWDGVNPFSVVGAVNVPITD
jgi:folate-dependent phosphoribosylglycinamide formyltransferase PurN